MRATQKNASTPFQLRGVGKQIAKYLAKLNIYSVEDLLFHLPIDYQDRTVVQTMNLVKPGEEVVVEGVIKSISTPTRGRTKLLYEITDGTRSIRLRFFHAHSFFSKSHKIGTRLRCYSLVRLGPTGLEMVHPECQIITPEKPIPIESSLTPIYPATEGLSQYTLRKLTANALAWMNEKNKLIELLPVGLQAEMNFPTLQAALQYLHRPPREALIEQLKSGETVFQKRLVFEELLAHRMTLLQLKTQFQSQLGVSLRNNHDYAQRFLKSLPFKLTNAQIRVAKEIKQDLILTAPMLRLVQGDVGSGKTVIAALAMLQAIENGYQAALMAPTELLAEQHFRVFQSWLTPLGVEIKFLSGQTKGTAKKQAIESIASGHAQIILGTHALFQEGVEFKNLALVVIDEQHRFGVEQRALFREKGTKDHVQPHQLIMTATPIPRTLAMSFYADLDCSVIDELPAGRTPIVTSVIPITKREEVMQRIREACQQGRQAYWVCPLIEASDVLNCQAAMQTAEKLQETFSDLKVGVIHGKMKACDKEVVMRAFQQGQIQLLVATTVIEVGVDVPNASVMIIENAERLGLSQLHQLRGRVGRGVIASHCVLLYQHPLSELAKERLAVMRQTTDGFVIAERDLELRGPGEVLGTKQTGTLAFRVADLVRDHDLFPQVQRVANELLQHHQGMIQPLIDRWLSVREQYGKV